MDCNIFGNRKKSGDTFVMIFLSNSLSRNVVEIEREKMALPEFPDFITFLRHYIA